jgi:hypothetical protein
MRFHVVNSLAQSSWRTFVDNNPDARIFHSPEMAAVFANTRNFTPTLWAALDQDTTVHALMLPVDITILPWPLRAVTTRTVVYDGILCSPGLTGQLALAALLRHYNAQRQSRTLFTELRNSCDTSSFQSAFKQNGFLYEEHMNFLIDLTQPTSVLWKNIRSNAQRNIRKAQKQNVVIEEAHTLQSVSDAYGILRTVYKRLRVPLPDVSLFHSAFTVLHPVNLMHVLNAKVNGVTIGALTLLLYKGTVLYWYTGSLREYSEYRVSDLLVWHALQLGQMHHCHTFDFGGGGRPTEDYTVRDFKAKFGGREVAYGRNVCVHSPLTLRAGKVGYSCFRALLS